MEMQQELSVGAKYAVLFGFLIYSALTVFLIFGLPAILLKLQEGKPELQKGVWRFLLGGAVTASVLIGFFMVFVMLALGS